MVPREPQTVINRAVEQAVAKGMDTSLREPIIHGVDKGRTVPVKESKRAPVALVMLTLSFVLGYYLARRRAKN